jgi:DNA-3-methyladenine glycosylase
VAGQQDPPPVLTAAGRPLTRGFFDRDPRLVAPELLGCLLEHRADSAVGLAGRDDPEPVLLRLTEVEAYLGAGEDPGSHAHRGPGRRNATMFRTPGHLYVYFTYGMHWCANLVCRPDGVAGAVLLRAGEVVAGLPSARRRRPTARRDQELASGPARLTLALGLTGADDGRDACGVGAVRAGARPAAERVAVGPRVGVSGEGAASPWRWWIAGDPTVSRYRPAAPSRRPTRSS